MTVISLKRDEFLVREGNYNATLIERELLAELQEHAKYFLPAERIPTKPINKPLVDSF